MNILVKDGINDAMGSRGLCNDTYDAMSGYDAQTGIHSVSAALIQNGVVFSKVKGLIDRLGGYE
jgi:hypothetical protein